MQIKTIAPFTILYFSTRTTLAGLGQFARRIPRELYREAVANDLEVTGPVYWNYYGFSNVPEAPFRLEIALPVAGEKPLSGQQFQFRQTEPFTCAALVHEGPWEDIPRTYGVVHQALRLARYKPNGNSREIYIHSDFSQPKNNVVEIQVEIVTGDESGGNA
jgi:effector-binding domain-containing protein